MLIIYSILILLLLLFIAIPLSTLHITFLFTHHGDDDFLRLKITLWKVISYTLELPEIKVNLAEKKLDLKEKSKGATKEKKKRKSITLHAFLNSYYNYLNLLRHVGGFYRILKVFFKKVTITDVKWNSRFGLGDAASTAVASGLVWALKGNVLGLLSHIVRLKGIPTIGVVPVYQGTLTQTRLSCMISFKIGHAIVVMLQVLKHWRSISSNANKKSKKYVAGGTSHV
ncbi:Protein of unknown function [Fictibacillus enclensis]|uniref:DUF2953 domain-containing protein n=1 Tax=Fictibacillus enclensis TaxID=1017270 RepID=A0A0V8J941_9BACL|nr:DUF2953 domain-containing protein [Fictibacillus enclensis]KSU83647.1 hypothetical protein AS030_13970 [Fictibacillus enclensis]SCC18948.1 Protein of unknown function [Fictibacillus enclensis]